MQANFEVALPSIPSKYIKFKIQDIKNKAFSAQKPRFNSNKQQLVKRFVNSFANLKQYELPKTQSTVYDKSDVLSTFSTKQSNVLETDTPKSQARFFIPETKRNLMLDYENKFKRYETPILKEAKYDKGFSFSKCYENNPQNMEASRIRQNKRNNHKKMENYYFSTNSNVFQEEIEEKDEENEKQKQSQKVKEKKNYIRPSAIFRNQHRWSDLERSLSKVNKNGPGKYQTQPLKDIEKPKTKKKKTKNPPQNTQKLKLQKLKNLTEKVTKILTPPKQSQQSLPQINQKPQKKCSQQNQSFFVKDDKDRFGDQIYPIAPKLNVPGPGSYEQRQGISDQVQKILIIQEQRKLLKQWFAS